MNISQSNTYKKDLSWLHFDNEPRVQVKDQQSCISAFVTYLTIRVAARGTSQHVTQVFHALMYSRFIEIQSNFR